MECDGWWRKKKLKLWIWVASRDSLLLLLRLLKSATVTIIMDRIFAVVGPTVDHFASRGVSWNAMSKNQKTKKVSVGQVVTSVQLFNVITRKCKHEKLLLIRLTESRKWNKIGRQTSLTRYYNKKKTTDKCEISSSTLTNDLRQSKQETFGYLLNEYQNNIAHRCVSKCHPVFISIFISPQLKSKQRFSFPISLSLIIIRLSHFYPSE